MEKNIGVKVIEQTLGMTVNGADCRCDSNWSRV